MLLTQRLYHEGVPGPVVLLFEGILISLAGVLAARWLFPSDVGLVAVFLGAISTKDSVKRVLQHNALLIYGKHQPPRVANLITTSRLASLFVGCVVGYSVVGLLVPAEDLYAMFSNQVRDVALGDLRRVRFGEWAAVATHNIGVALLFFLLALPFRDGGVMLALCWNASVWGASFGLLAQNMASRLPLGLLDAWLRVLIAHAPHLLLEALAFTIAGTAGTFLSQGVERHRLDSSSLPGLLRSIWIMSMVALLLIGLAALIESTLAPRLVAWLAP